MGLDIARQKEKGRTGKGSLILGTAVNLFLLGFFKYYGFLAENLEQLLPVVLPKLELSLPIGLSFYTFQSISYLADVYRGKARRQTNLISFGLYISMFPQLVAGPIVQYADIDLQLKKRTESWEAFGEGTEYFIRGLAKKVLLANNLGAVYEAVTGLPSLSVLSAWVGAAAFTFQIYFDFSGYSDMAVGLGRMFGFRFRENFRHPYCSRSVTEFWRRWHISLGSWFREYVYIPLGGNRVGVLRHIVNLLIVWTLTGLWHGKLEFCSLGSVLRGDSDCGKICVPGSDRQAACSGNCLYDVYGCDRMGVFLQSHFIGSGCVSSGDVWKRRAACDRQGGNVLSSASLILFAVSWICSTPLPERISRILWKQKSMKKILAAACFVLLFLSTAYLIHDTYNPFLYFRF